MMPTLHAAYVVLLSLLRFGGRRSPAVGSVADVIDIGAPVVAAAQDIYGAAIEARVPPVLATVLSVGALTLPAVLAAMQPPASDTFAADDMQRGVPPDVAKLPVAVD